MAQVEVEIRVGGRNFEVACQEGEETYLHSAAALLDAEAQVLVSQIGRMPEARMLLMAGLMLADKTAGLEEKLREAEAKLAQAGGAPVAAAPASAPATTTPELSAKVAERLEALAAQAEAVAARVDEKLTA